jgi:type I restriction enzyme, S subunit
MNMQRVRLGELGEWGSGGTPLASRTAFYGGEIPWLIIEDLNDGVVRRSARTISKAGLQNSSAKLVPRGTLLVAMYGSIGKLGISGMECATNQAMAFCKCDPMKVDSAFLFFLLLHERPHFIRAGRGGTQQNISQEFLKNYEICLPSLSDQRRMSEELKVAERFRRTRRYALELSDTFPKSGFASLFGSAAEAMKRFPVFALGELTDFIDYRGISPNKQPSGVRLVTARNVKRGYFEIEPQEFIPVQEYESWMRRGMPRPGDVLFTTEGHTLGSAAKLPTFEKAALAQRLIALQPGQRITSNYLLHFVLTPLFQDEVIKRSTGSAARGITSKQLAEIKIPVPPLSMQSEFSSLVVRAERLRALQRESLRQADHLFQTLLHRAFATQN